MSSPPFTQKPYSIDVEREIYQKWLQKCQEESNINRAQNEQKIIDTINDERNLLYRLGNMPDARTPIPSKFNMEYMPSSPKDVSQNNSNRSQSAYPPTVKGTNHSLYTLDGYPRGNYKGFYDNVTNGYGIRRSATEITSSEAYDKVNNPTYDEYKEKQREFLNFNQHTIDDNLRYKGYLFNEKKRLNEIRLQESQRLKELEYQEKMNENESKKVYKDLLDNQLKVKIPSKLGYEYYNNDINSKAVKFKNPQLYTFLPENSFMNRNKLVEINPYSLKQNELGNSMLIHNPIINPVFDYKYNKYLFPRDKSPFQNAAQSALHN